jgi:hypothetical protein
MKTITKPQLRKLLKTRTLQARRTGRYTDDYAFDNAVNFGKTDWQPIVYLPPSRINPESKDLFIWTDENLKHAKAYTTKDGIIQAGPHWDSWQLRITQQLAPAPDLYLVHIKDQILEFPSYNPERAIGAAIHQLGLYGQPGHYVFIPGLYEADQELVRIQVQLKSSSPSIQNRGKGIVFKNEFVIQ